jgi:hypothetical protein
MIIEFFVVTCLNLSAPNSCEDVFVVDSTQYPPLAEICNAHSGRAGLAGQLLAAQFLGEHPDYAEPKRHFNGYHCTTTNRPLPKKGSA